MIKLEVDEDTTQLSLNEYLCCTLNAYNNFTDDLVPLRDCT